MKLWHGAPAALAVQAVRWRVHWHLHLGLESAFLPQWHSCIQAVHRCAWQSRPPSWGG